MLDRLASSVEYHQRADRCRELARVTASQDTRTAFETLAKRYDDMADTELKLAIDGHNTRPA
jgi:hypothetical protein